MKRTVVVVVLLLGIPLTVVACLWDRDTPADEAKGMPEVVAVITGRFERNPPLFYEMRLKRVTEELQSHPEKLELYDDAGVASDRLGCGDQAISWMKKKREQLDKLDASRPEVKEQLYRYHANLGTFLVHRWMKQGADRAKLSEVKAARNEIARALEINPDAHFGREKYQLKAIDWIIEPPPMPEYGSLPSFLVVGKDLQTAKMADEAVRGLAGLVALGNAWESVDVFHAMSNALRSDSVGFEKQYDGGRNTLAYLTWLRCCELIDAGKGSMLPNAPKGAQLKKEIVFHEFLDEKNLNAWFPKLRDDANAWQEARNSFLMARLKEGRHPDTDPTFWNGYIERPALKLPSGYSAEYTHRHGPPRKSIILWSAVGVTLVSVVLFVAIRLIRRAQPDRLKSAPPKVEFGEM
jgi:hypothetical protein